MNNERRRINELNTLSAYLDNALNKKEAEKTCSVLFNKLQSFRRALGRPRTVVN